MLEKNLFFPQSLVCNNLFASNALHNNILKQMLSASQCLLKNDNLMHRDKRWGWGGGGRIPGSSFMELEKFRLCQAKMWEERTRAKHGGLSSRTMSTALVTLEQGWIVPGSCITHKANFCLTEQQGFFFFFFFLEKKTLFLNVTKYWAMVSLSGRQPCNWETTQLY